VRILSRGETLKGMQEHIDISNIPEFYGGQLDFGGKDSCRFKSPEVYICIYVYIYINAFMYIFEYIPLP
jgi:hypothetical protein